MKKTIDFRWLLAILMLPFLSLEAQIQNKGLSVGGTLDGWELYTGTYTPNAVGKDEDGTIYEYTLTWKETDEAAARKAGRILLSSNLGATDPIIACSDFYVNPDNETVIQIGKNSGKAEGLNTGAAYAERMKYSFVVTDESTLFTYKYSCVLHVPTSDSHTSYQMPAFNISVLLTSPEGKKITLPCEEFSGNASFNNSLIRNLESCRESKVESGQNPEDYVYQPWTTVSYDLTEYLGYTVTIEINNHDCLVTNVRGVQQAGSHKSYGYFWGKTEPLRLIPRNCGNDDAVITAPKGFVKYNWYRCDDYMPLSSSNNVATIPADEIVDGAHYCCEMIGSNEACTRILTDTVLSTIDLIADFGYENDCNMTINFMDKSVVNRDEIKKYRWDFGDGYSSAEASPSHEYAEAKNYTVSLTIVSGKGCSTTITKPVTVRPLPQLNIDGDQNVCQGDPIALSCLSSQIGNKFFWLNQAGDTVSNDISLQEKAQISQTYRVYIVDQYSCEYFKDVYVGVSTSPSLFIKGDSSVCYNTPAKLWVWGDADKYVWSTTYVGDTLHFTPQQSSDYCVTGTYTQTGCKTTKCVTLKVNPLPDVVVDGPGHICSGDMATLKADGADEYLWQDVYYGDSLMITPEKTATYTVIGTDTNGCSNTTDYKLIVYTSPEVVVHGNKDVCEGESLNLWLEGAQEYLWDDGTTSSVVTRKPILSTTSYWVEGSTNGCVTKVNIPIVVNQVPTVVIHGKDEICAGEEVTLYAQGANQYEWSTGETENHIDKKLTSGQTFNVKGLSEKGCVSSATYKINVHPLPIFDIEGPSFVCDSTVVTLTAKCENEDCTYQWDNGFLGSSYEAFVVDTTKFEVVATDTAFGCYAKKEYAIYAFPYPKLRISGKTTLCSGTALNLSVSGAVSYEWSEGTKSNNLVALTNTSTTFWVKGTTNGCTSQLNVPVTILPSPYMWVDGKTNLCYGDSLYLTARGADSYIWNASVRGEDYKSQPNMSSSVTVVGTNEEGCSSKLVIPYTVLPKPMVTITGFETVCKNSNLTLTASGKNLVQFVWNTGESNQNITVPVPEDTTFEVTAWDMNGCYNSATHKVRTLTPPPVSFTGETTVCEGEMISLLAQGASNYTWSENQSVFQQGDRLVYTPKGSSVITLVGSMSNCSSALDIYVTVNAKPNVGIVGTAGVCRGEDYILTATGADKYVWGTGDTTATISYPISTSSTFFVNGISNNGCNAKKSIFVEVYPDLNVSLEEVRKSGCPDAPTTVELHAEGALVYTWSSEPNNLTISGTSSYNLEAMITEPTDVYVIGTDSKGCHGYDTLRIEPKTHDEVSYKILPAIIEKGDPTVHFNGYQPKNATWTWNPGDGSDPLEGKNVSYTYQDQDVVTEDSFKVVVKARDEEGCIYKQSSYVYVWKDIWAPTAFSPNGDGLNDVFRFKGGDFIEKFHYIIFNRLGTIMFEGNSIEDVWDGNFPDGSPCPQEVYGWVVDFYSNYKGIGKQGERRGFVSIIK